MSESGPTKSLTSVEQYSLLLLVLGWGLTLLALSSNSSTSVPRSPCPPIGSYTPMEGDGAFTSGAFFRARGEKAFYFVPAENRPYNTSELAPDKRVRIIGQRSGGSGNLRIQLPDGRCWAGSVDQAIAMTHKYPKVDRGIFSAPQLAKPAERSLLLAKLAKAAAPLGGLLGANLLILGLAWWRNQQLRKKQAQLENNELLTGTLTQGSEGFLLISDSEKKLSLAVGLAPNHPYEGDAFIVAPSVTTQEAEYREQAMPIVTGATLVMQTVDAYRQRLGENRLQIRRWTGRALHLSAWIALGILLFN